MKAEKEKSETKASLSLIELASKSACPPHQLLEFVLLHLHLAPSFGADRMHGVVVAASLAIGHASGVARRINCKTLMLTSRSFHLVVANERTRRGLIGLTAVSVARFPNGQNSRVCGKFLLVLRAGFHGLDVGVHVHGNRGRGRVEWAKATSVLLHRHLGLGTIEQTELTISVT